MALDPLTATLDFGGKIIDKLFPDKNEAQKQKLALMEMAQRGELSEMQIRLSAIIEEAKSSDPWTSRARPSFLYVMYLMILASVPMGVLSIFNPGAAVTIAEGMKSWLAAIPSEMWWTFGVGYTGYTAFRSLFDKGKPAKLAEVADSLRGAK